MTSRPYSSETQSDKISVWVIEDDALFRNTLVTILNGTTTLKCDISFSSCEDALAHLEEAYAPEVLLMDIGLPGMDGIEGVRRIKSISPATDIIILTIFEEDEKIFKAICNGANGYLLKSASAEDIVGAIQEVLQGGAPMNAQIARRVLTMFSGLARPAKDSDAYKLTEREKEILKLMVDGLSKKMIAERLYLSYFTIDTHIKNMYQKLQVHSRSEALAKAWKEQIV